MPTKSTIRLGSNLVLPDDAVTGTFGFIGNRGSGKTYGAKVMAEEMLKLHAQVVVLDPVDAWYGLRYGAKRGHSGLPVYVFGGAHGDAPLEATAGKLLADVVVEQGISAVFSMRHLPKAAQRRFVKDFAEQLYLRKGEDQYRSAIHVFIEEAHTFAPQTQGRGEDLACLGAIQDLVLQGRGSGIGVTLVTQRVQAVSKAVLELTEVMCAFRTTGPLARKKLKEWFEAQDGEDHLKEFLAAITTLQPGNCWVWSPGYLELFKHAKFRQAETFDSSATPKGGQRRPTPSGKAAKLDLAALGDQIRETVERVVANDPKKLHAEIKRLQTELAKRPEGTKVEEIIKVERIVEREVVEMVPEIVRQLLEALDEQEEHTKKIKGLARVLRGYKPKRHKPEVISSATAPKRGQVAAVGSVPKFPPAPKAATSKPHPPTPRPPSDVHIDKMPRAILTVLAQYPDGRTNTQLTTMTGYRYSGGFKNALTALRNAAYMLGGNTEVMRITPAGLDAIGDDWEPLPTGRDLFDWWMSNQLQGMERDILTHLVEIYPEAIIGTELAEVVGKAYSGGFKNALTKLRTLAIAEGGNTKGVRITDDFAEAIA